MNLTDKEILELSNLCSGVVDETLTSAQKTRLTQLLSESRAARQYYVRALGLSASLYSYASEMQVDASDDVASAKIIPVTFRWVLAGLAAAAAIVLVLWLARARSEIAEAARAEDLVAQVTGLKECEWAAGVTALSAGEHLRKGQRLELMKGLAEITFDSGAQVVIEGPVSLDVNSAWDATLARGTIKVTVPTEAIGFRVADRAVEVVDLGTEFTMIAEASGATDVLVLKGAVEAAPQNSAEPQTILLREKQSRRFSPTGISEVHDSDVKFARFSGPVQLERFAPPTGYVHWSFDETDGRLLKAEALGQPLTAFDARLEGRSGRIPASHVEGRRGQALQFNGHSYAKAPFPGLSGNLPRTVAFWVKVPQDAQLSDAYAMLAWRAVSKKLGSRPVHIGWNRNPGEGTVGVLRTDYGGGFALGATPLRDGRWHHIAVVFVPGESADTPVQVNEYVDGRLEGEGHPSAPGKRGDSEPSVDDPAAVNDAVWLGCRLGLNGPRKDRFRGEVDELFLADRALGPREIVHIMKDNQLIGAELVSAKRPE